MDKIIKIAFGLCFALALYAVSHAQQITGAGGGRPCTTTASSIQFNNAGVFGCSTLTQNGGGLVLSNNGTDQFLIRGQLVLGFVTLANVDSTIGMGKITTSSTAAGAAGIRIETVCGTNAGSAKLIIYGGTSTTPVTITDNIGTGVTGC